MIDKIELYNFEAHKNTIIDFVNGINVITGASDNGKSSILRAVNWVINNKPNGDSFITHGEDECRVILHINNNKIERYKNKKKGVNSYIFNDKKEFNAIGSDIPDEITQLINFDDVNLQKQFDSHFLLSESSGEVARVLNKIIHLDIIDKTLSNIESMKREGRKKVNDLISMEEKLSNDLNRYDWLDKAENILLNIELLNDEKNIKTNDKNTLSEVMQKVNTLIFQKEKINKKLVYLNDIKEIENDYNKFKKQNDSYIFLKNSCNKLNGIVESNYNLTSILDLSSDIQEIEDESKQLVSLKSNIGNLKEVVNLNSELLRYNLIIDSIEKDIKEIMPSVCPFCNQEMKK